MAQIQICSMCAKEWKTESGYLNHVCEATGNKPTEPEHLGSAFMAVSRSAVNRGNARQGKPPVQDTSTEEEK